MGYRKKNKSSFKFLLAQHKIQMAKQQHFLILLVKMVGLSTSK